MNCQDFETIIVEIARDRLMDAMARERGLEHAEKCARCATLQAEERALSAGLRAFSVEAGAEEIPARLETALLTAFRQRAAAPAVAPASSLGRRRWLLAAALALLTFGFSLAGLSLARWIASSSDRESAVTSSTDGQADRRIAPTPTGVSATSEKFGYAPTQAITVQRPTRPIPDLTVEKRQKRLPLAAAGRQSAGSVEPREFVTRFFPIIQGGELIPLESGQIVRVRMPRSNLIPLGIPLSQERINETIQADVLVSNDGLARAIRLVY